MPDYLDPSVETLACNADLCKCFETGRVVVHPEGNTSDFYCTSTKHLKIKFILQGFMASIYKVLGFSLAPYGRARPDHCKSELIPPYCNFYNLISVFLLQVD